MTIPAPSPATAASLERRVERLTAAVAVLAVGLALSVLWHFVPRPQLDASRFILRGGKGAWRGSLEMDTSGNPVLRLNDANGRAMLYGVVIADGTTRLRLADTTGLSRVVFEVGTDRTPHAWLLDSGGRTGVHARLAADGQPIVELRRGARWRQFTLGDTAAAPETRSPRDGSSRGQ
jgi:hypothetical protein